MANITITPQGSIYLCKTPLENDYKNQLTFANAAAQLTYFNSVIQHTYNEYTYIKKDNVVNVGDNIDNIIDCNYLFYKNTGFTTKYYFCFITNMEYVNENCTRITFETDCFQSYMFNITYKTCFVEREHVSDDTVGLHTIPENLETGEYISNGYTYYNGLDSLRYVIQVTEWTDSTNKPLATNYGGVYMAGGAYICDSITTVVNILQAFATAGKSDAVYNVYMVPTNFINNTSGTAQYSGQSSPSTATTNFDKQVTIDGYNPVNNKVLTFPYNYILMSNNNGTSNILHYERFTTTNCGFKIKGVPTVGGSIKCVPTSYDHVAENEEQGIMAGKLPTLNWSNDEYTNWLTQNSVNIGLGIASSGLTILGGIGMMATGGGALKGASSIVSGGMGIANELGAIYEHSLQPNSARGNVNGGDINVCDSKNGFWFYKMSIKSEYAKVIDKYFSAYGYKVNTIKIPNITGRRYWNYVKTIDCNIEGDIPITDLEIIRQMFNNGVTLWHDVTKMYDYSQSNTIVS